MRFILSLVLLLSGLEVLAAEKGSVTFRISSSSKYIVGVAFYSQSRTGWVWPEPHKHYDLKDSQPHDFKVRCEVGEEICFGGFWNNLKKQWGVGMDNKLNCKGCCLTCAYDEENAYHAFNLTDY